MTTTPVVDELTIMDRFIKAKLEASIELADHTSGVFRGVASEKAAFPLVVFRCLAPTDTVMGGGARFYTDAEYLVTVVDTVPSESSVEIGQISAELDAVLEGATDTDVWECGRVRPWSNSYVENSVQYEERGGVYSIAVKAQN